MDQSQNQQPMPAKKTWMVWAGAVVIILVCIGGYYAFMQKPAPATDQTQSTQENSNSQTNNTNQNTMDNTQGLKIETLKEGSGVGAKTGDTVTVNYTGKLTDGTVFDSSLNSGRTPFQFTLGQNRVIQGWEQGVLGMKVGEKRKLTIPPELGYGSQDYGPIPGNSTLTFEIDLLKIN
jgi:FKBP-type peptidyl-prolyl cis-trans isomerase